MKNSISLSLLTLLPLNMFIAAADHELSSQSVKLESRVLSLVDGSFINADTLEIMRSFQRMLMEILLGKKTDDGMRVGDYICNGKKMCLFELAQYEEQLEQQKNNYTAAVYDAKMNELKKAIA